MWYVRNLIAKVHRLFLLTPVSQNILKCSSHSGWSGADFAKLRMALKNFEEFEEVKKWLSAVKERSKGSYLSGFRLYVEFSGKNPKELIDEIEGDREKPRRERGKPEQEAQHDSQDNQKINRSRTHVEEQGNNPIHVPGRL